MSILCQCVRNDISLYYLLSNNYVNIILNFDYDFMNEEICDNFISFMKSLSCRLNQQTVQFFIVDDNQSFTLLSRAINFVGHRDITVKKTVSC